MPRTPKKPRARRRREFYDEEEVSERRRALDDGGVPREQEGVQSEDDEDVDDDAAFNEEDEEAFGEIFRKLARRGKTGDASEDEGSEEEEEGDEDDEGGMLLTDLVDRAERGPRGDEDAKKEDEVEPSDSAADDSAADDSAAENSSAGDNAAGENLAGDGAANDDDGVSDSALEDSDRESSSDAGEAEAPVDFGALQSAVNDFGSLRDLARQRERSAQHFVSQLGDERELAAGLTSSSGGLSVAALKRGLEKPAAGAEESFAGKVAAATPRAARVHEERAERRIAYKRRNEDMDKWTGLVQSARRAEHLDFSNDVQVKSSSASLIQAFVPATDLEKSVSALLQQAGARKDAVPGVGDETYETLEAEALEGREVTPEELKERRAQLMKMRNVLFYDEQKRRRANKIKSKAFRRIMRRKRGRNPGDHADDVPEAPAEESRAAVEKRMMERMSLKHKSTSKWAKRVMSRGNKADKDERAAVMAQLRLGQELRSRMGIAASGDTEGDSDSSGDWDLGSDEDKDEDEDKRRGKVLAQARGRAQALLDDIDQDADEAQGGGAHGGGKPGTKKGLFAMGFMQKALKRQREEARREAEALLEELEAQDHAGSSGAEDDGPDGADDADGSTGPATLPTAGPPTSEPAATLAPTSIDDAGTAVFATGGTGSALVRVNGAMTVDLGDAEAPNAPETTGPASAKKRNGGGKQQRRNAGTEKHDSAGPGAAAANPWLSQSARDATLTSAEAPAAQNGIDDGLKLLLHHGDHAKVAPAFSSKRKRRDGAAAKAGIAQASRPASQGQHASSAESGDADGVADGVANGDLAGASSDALLKEAFADPVVDEVLDELAAEKMREVEDEIDMDKSRRQRKRARKLRDEDEDENVGWGTWAGSGVKQSRKQKLQKRQRKEEAQEKRQNLLKLRKDRGMDRVVISERRNTAAAGTLQVGALPYPFTSREEYERAMRLPLGRDWNTSAVAKNLARVPVRLRAGTVIAPASSVKVNHARAQALRESKKKRKEASRGRRRPVA